MLGVKGIGVKTIESDGHTPLSWVAKNRCEETQVTAKLLAEEEPNPNSIPYIYPSST